MPADHRPISTALVQDREGLLADWIEQQRRAPGARSDLLTDAEVRTQSERLLGALGDALARGGGTDTESEAWEGVRSMLAGISASRAQQGFSPTETASFVFALRRPLAARLRAALHDDPAALAESGDALHELIDRLGLHTTEAFQQSREDVIRRQQDELLELSTPVVKLWDGVLAVPLIGALDSARTQVVMESLLQKIVETESGVAIIDITGVPMVDTLVAQHLLKTVAAARLMGADCIISGIRPQIAQTIVHLGIDIQHTATKATLADALRLALRQTGWAVTKLPG